MKEPFEIDRIATNYVLEDLDETWTRKFDAAAYEFGMGETDICHVLAIVLRDALLRIAGYKVPSGKPIASGKPIECHS